MRLPNNRTVTKIKNRVSNLMFSSLLNHYIEQPRKRMLDPAPTD